MKKRLNIGLLAFAAVCIIYAGSKAISYFTFDPFLADKGCTVAAEGIYIDVVKRYPFPDDTPIKIYARATNSTDAADWYLKASLPYSSLPATIPSIDPHGEVYYLLADYVPPSPVHTNDVWEIRGFEVPDDNTDTDTNSSQGQTSTYAFPNTKQELIKEPNP